MERLSQIIWVDPIDYSILRRDTVFPGGSDGKMSVYNEGDRGSIPGSGRFPGEGNDNPLQYSCLENPMDGVAWGRKVSNKTEQLHFHFLSRRDRQESQSQKKEIWGTYLVV